MLTVVAMTLLVAVACSSGIRDGYAKATTCYDYVQVNSTGTAFGPGETRLCGAALTP